MGYSEETKEYELGGPQGLAELIEPRSASGACKLLSRNFLDQNGKHRGTSGNQDAPNTSVWIHG
jgi:hypothetical protein